MIDNYPPIGHIKCYAVHAAKMNCNNVNSSYDSAFFPPLILLYSLECNETECIAMFVTLMGISFLWAKI